MKDSVVFSRLMDEYRKPDEETEHEGRKSGGKTGASDDNDDDLDKKKPAATLMQAEERNTGSVSWDVYANYLRFAGGIIWAPIIIILLTITQGAQGKSGDAWVKL
jgi:ATP-binding cassette subfamily C (CFTR/MRP) protein 1